jgi:hypothetical protein
MVVLPESVQLRPAGQVCPAACTVRLCLYHVTAAVQYSLVSLTDLTHLNRYTDVY